MAHRAQLLADLAEEIRAVQTDGIARVAIDGVDGAGKTVFADELADALGRTGARAVRVSVDGFHNPRHVRHRLGRGSPEGFYLDSYDYVRFVSLVLEPMSPGGSRLYTPAVYDVLEERAVTPVSVQAPRDAVLVVDGIFLHRDELISFWDYSVWLDVPFTVSVPRGARRGPGFGDADPADPSNRRYVEGQLIYIRECRPAQRATVTVDNTNLESPILRRRASV